MNEFVRLSLSVIVSIAIGSTIGIENGKTKANIGTLWRSAHNMDA